MFPFVFFPLISDSERRHEIPRLQSLFLRYQQDQGAAPPLIKERRPNPTRNRNFTGCSFFIFVYFSLFPPLLFGLTLETVHMVAEALYIKSVNYMDFQKVLDENHGLLMYFRKRMFFHLRDVCETGQQTRGGLFWHGYFDTG